MTGTHRLFVAVWPSSRVRAGLAELDVRDGPAIRAVPSPNWHVTLRFVGLAEPGTVIDRLSQVELPRVHITYGPVVIRFVRGQTVVPVAGVEPLAHPVAAATADVGEPPRPDFVGHLTVGRSPRRGADEPNAVIGRRFEAEQTVQSVALVASDLNGARAAYRTVATFPTS